MEESLAHLSVDFYNKFIQFISSNPEDEDFNSIEFKLVSAAHFLATQWEFNVIAHFSPPLFGVESTREEIQSQVDKHLEIKSVKKILYLDKNRESVLIFEDNCDFIGDGLNRENSQNFGLGAYADCCYVKLLSFLIYRT